MPLFLDCLRIRLPNSRTTQSTHLGISKTVTFQKSVITCLFRAHVYIPVSSWPDGFAFILGFLAPLWVVGGFDSTVHISKEARNASTAIPWAVMLSTAVSCVLGWGAYFRFFVTELDHAESSCFQRLTYPWRSTWEQTLTEYYPTKLDNL